MNKQIRKLKGANMDIDLATPPGNIAWGQDVVRGIKQKAQTHINVRSRTFHYVRIFAASNISIHFCVVTQTQIRYAV